MAAQIIIDGKEYDVALTELKRKADILDKYAERSEDGILHREVIGTYYNYTLKIRVNNDIKLYNELFDVLSAPVASHSVKLINEEVQFDGYFSSIEDEVSRVTPEGTIYKGLSCRLTAMAPRRYANGG